MQSQGEAERQQEVTRFRARTSTYKCKGRKRADCGPKSQPFRSAQGTARTFLTFFTIVPAFIPFGTVFAFPPLQKAIKIVLFSRFSFLKTISLANMNIFLILKIRSEKEFVLFVHIDKWRFPLKIPVFTRFFAFLSTLLVNFLCKR